MQKFRHVMWNATYCVDQEAVVCRVTENQIGCKFTSDARRDAAEFASYINERIARKS
jgi:hypothetical protein